MSAVDTLFATASELRRDFDRSFAAARHAAEGETEDLLAIQLGTEPYALRLVEISGLFADRRVAPVPSGVAELLGIAGVRGVILPVYDLRLLLGHTPRSPARWLVVAAARPVALAFDAVDGHLRVGRGSIAGGVGDASAPTLEVVRVPEARPVVSLAPILERVERRARELQLTREP